MTIDHEAQDKVRSALDTTERLLWSGRPQQGIMMRGSDAIPALFGLVWTVAAFPFLATEDILHRIDLTYVLMPGVFLVIGLYLLIGRFIVDALRRRNTIYGVTNQRVIIQSGVIGRRLKSLNLRTLSDITLSEKPGGDGTILLGPQINHSSWSVGYLFSTGPISPALEGVEEARQVFNILREAQRES